MTGIRRRRADKDVHGREGPVKTEADSGALGLQAEDPRPAPSTGSSESSVNSFSFGTLQRGRLCLPASRRGEKQRLWSVSRLAHLGHSTPVPGQRFVQRHSLASAPALNPTFWTVLLGPKGAGLSRPQHLHRGCPRPGPGPARASPWSPAEGGSEGPRPRPPAVTARNQEKWQEGPGREAHRGPQGEAQPPAQSLPSARSPPWPRVRRKAPAPGTSLSAAVLVRRRLPSPSSHRPTEEALAAP